MSEKVQTNGDHGPHYKSMQNIWIHGLLALRSSCLSTLIHLRRKSNWFHCEIIFTFRNKRQHRPATETSEINAASGRFGFGPIWPSSMTALGKSGNVVCNRRNLLPNISNGGFVRSRVVHAQRSIVQSGLKTALRRCSDRKTSRTWVSRSETRTIQTEAGAAKPASTRKETL